MQILLIEDNPGDIRLLQEYLSRDSGATGGFQVMHADRLASGLERLAEANFDAVLLDLSLPDSHGMDTLVRMRAAAKGIPFVVLTSIEDEALGMQLIQAGAQDYLVKGQVTGSLLRWSLRHAVERKRMVVALGDSEERVRNLVEGTGDVIFTLSKEGVITSLNPAFERMTQWPRERWVGQPFATLLHPDDLPLAIDFFQRIVEKREAPTCALRIRSHERGDVVGEFVGAPQIQNGQIFGVLGIVRDITERKRVEDTLDRLRHLYGLLLTSAHDGIYGIDLQGHAIFVNPAAARMIGSSSEELLGRHMHAIVHHTKPDGTVYPPEECPIYRAFHDGVVQYVADEVFWRTDGTSFPVEYTSTPIVERSGIVGAVVTFRDITERKRAEQELCESEARFRAILDNCPNLVFLKDLQGRYLHINRQFERGFHISREAIVGKTDEEVFPSEQVAAFRTNDLKVLQAGVPIEFEEVALHDDGPHTSIVYKFPLYDGDGKPYALCGMTTDITQRKAMEKALQQAEEKYRDIFDNAVEGMFQSTPSGRYLNVNPALSRMCGYESPEELMGSVTDIEHEVYVDPDRREALRRLLERQGAVRGFECEVRRKDGSTIWVSESVRAVWDDGEKVLYFEGTIEDITERRRSEEERKRFTAMIESSNDAIMSLTEGLVSFWNPAAEKLFGYSSEEILGKPVNILVPSHLRGEVERNFESILRGEQIQDYETERVRKDGSIVPVSLTISPLKDAHGKIVGSFAIIRDITERKRAEKELQRTLDQVRTLSRRLEVVREDERTRIARELHDELGMRLTCLKMDLSRLQPRMTEAPCPKPEEKVLSMIEQVDATIAAVQGLVAELRPGVLDDLGLVAAIEWQCRDFERRSGIRCLFDSKEEDIPLDSARATVAFRICQEALTNVVRHAKATEVRVHLEELDRGLLLEIHDDGQGIVPEEITAATSLGLLGMRERAGAVGGALEIIGRPGQGTTVTLRLPSE